MDSGLMIKELAAQIGVTEDTVINWEIRGIKPVGRNIERVMDFIKKGSYSIQREKRRKELTIQKGKEYNISK